jgi:hypothetical protein
MSWVDDHRKHHAFSNRPGEPHSPHVDHGVGWRGALRGFVHAHVGWLFRHDQRGSRARYAPDLLADPVIRFVDRTFVLRALGGLALAFGLGAVIGGSLTAGLTGLLQGKRARRQSDPARPLRTRSGRVGGRPASPCDARIALEAVVGSSGQREPLRRSRCRRFRVAQRRSPAVADIIGARLARTVAMISSVSMPYKYMDVVPGWRGRAGAG